MLDPLILLLRGLDELTAWRCACTINAFGSISMGGLTKDMGPQVAAMVKDQVRVWLTEVERLLALSAAGGPEAGYAALTEFEVGLQFLADARSEAEQSGHSHSVFVVVSSQELLNRTTPSTGPVLPLPWNDALEGTKAGVAIFHNAVRVAIAKSGDRSAMKAWAATFLGVVMPVQNLPEGREGGELSLAPRGWGEDNDLPATVIQVTVMGPVDEARRWLNRNMSEESMGPACMLEMVDTAPEVAEGQRVYAVDLGTAWMVCDRNMVQLVEVGRTACEAQSAAVSDEPSVNLEAVYVTLGHARSHHSTGYILASGGLGLSAKQVRLGQKQVKMTDVVEELRKQALWCYLPGSEDEGREVLRHILSRRGGHAAVALVKEMHWVSRASGVVGLYGYQGEKALVQQLMGLAEGGVIPLSDAECDEMMINKPLCGGVPIGRSAQNLRKLLVVLGIEYEEVRKGNKDGGGEGRKQWKSF